MKTIIQLVSAITTQTKQSIKGFETSLKINNLHKKVYPPNEQNYIFVATGAKFLKLN